MELRLDLTGFSDYEIALTRMIAMLTDLRPFWPKLVPLWVEWMREQFEHEGAWAGDPWAPLSADYLVQKQRLYPGKGILYATGKLRRAASMPKRVVTPRSITFIVDDRTIDWHQKGNKRGMPARPVVPTVLPLHAQLQVEAAAQEWVDEMAYKLGLR